MDLVTITREQINAHRRCARSDSVLDYVLGGPGVDKWVGYWTVACALDLARWDGEHERVLALGWLDGRDIVPRVLRGADLTGAKLAGADLRGATLTNAILTNADLRGADLVGAILAGADLRGADLAGAIWASIAGAIR